MKRTFKITLFALSSVFLLSPVNSAHAHDEGATADMIFHLRAEIAQLREEIRLLPQRINHSSSNAPKWGCYMKDMRAGGISGSGFTKSEAKGVVLEKCAAREGVCFTNDVTCSSE